MKQQKLCVLLSILMLLTFILSACSGTGTTEVTAEQSIPSTDQESDHPETEPEITEDLVKGTYKHVVIIGVDGAGAYFKNANTPNIDRIFENGAVTYKMLTSNPTISAQCWGSLLHGVTPEYHGLNNTIAASTPYPLDSKFPSFFKVIRENNSDAVLASFCNWFPINAGMVENQIGVQKAPPCADDATLAQEVCNYLSQKTPTALFVQFSEPDIVGESKGFGTKAHLDQITLSDTYIGQIYQALESKGILDDTLFIVTADHGGNGKTHGGWTDTEKYVMFAACGKMIEKSIPESIEIRDIAAIVLFALGYDCPDTWTARVPSNLFVGVTAKTRPVYTDSDSKTK